MSLRAWVALALTSAITVSALAQDRDTAHANVEVGACGGGRSAADVTPALARIRTALARCAEQGRNASGNEVRVTLAIAENGRVSAAPIGDSAAPAFQTCVVGALPRVRLAPGETGTIELRVSWHEPRGYGTATLGGFHSRSSSLPEHARAERAAPPYPDAQVTSVAQAHDAEVRHCFASELAHRPDVAGTIELRFTIGLDGSVASASVANDDVHVPAINECLIARVQSWTFPAPTSGEAATVTHAFALR